MLSVVKTQSNRSAIFALAAAATLWGLNVPLTKLALGWLGPGWVTVARFAVAAPILAVVGRRGLRDALTVRLLASGAIGFGAVIVLQNAGIERTSVSHAAVVVGAIPVLVALIAAGLGQAVTRALTWAGYGVALVGIAFVAGAGGGGASPRGDLLVFGSVVLSAAFIAVQPRLLAGLLVVGADEALGVRRHRRVGDDHLDAVLVGRGVVDFDLLATERGIDHVCGHLGEVAGILEDGRVLVAAQHRSWRQAHNYPAEKMADQYLTLYKSMLMPAGKTTHVA